MGDLANVLGEINEMGLSEFLIVMILAYLGWIAYRAEKRQQKQEDRFEEHLDKQEINMDKLAEAVRLMATTNTNLAEINKQNGERLGRIEQILMQK